MTSAVIQLQGKQFFISPGETIVVDQLEHEDNSSFDISDVLLVTDGKKVEIGTPLVKNANVKAKVVSHQKSKKIEVAKFRSKSRYRRVKGHRQHQSTIEITSISAK